MKRNLLVGAIAALSVSVACAFEPFTVKDIRVEGIQRTEAGTVFSYLPVRVGDTMTDEKAAQARLKFGAVHAVEESEDSEETTEPTTDEEGADNSHAQPEAEPDHPPAHE